MLSDLGSGLFVEEVKRGAEMVESLSSSRGVRGREKGLLIGSINPPTGVIISSALDPNSWQPALGLAPTFRKAGVGGPETTDFPSTSIELASFSSASDTVDPATLRSKEFDKSWVAKRRLRCVAVTDACIRSKNHPLGHLRLRKSFSEGINAFSMSTKSELARR